MNTSLEEMLKEAIDYIDSLSVDEFEQELRSVGLNPIRKTVPKHIVPIDATRDNILSLKCYIISYPKVVVTQFSCEQDVFFEIAA